MSPPWKGRETYCCPPMEGPGDMLVFLLRLSHSVHHKIVWQDNEVLNDVNFDMINHDLNVKHSNFFLTTL